MHLSEAPPDGRSFRLDQTDWCHIFVSSACEVVAERQDADNCKDNNGPVEVRRRSGVANKNIRWPEREEEGYNEEHESYVVDHSSKSSQRPAAWRKRLATDSPQA